MVVLMATLSACKTPSPNSPPQNGNPDLSGGFQCREGEHVFNSFHVSYGCPFPAWSRLVANTLSILSTFLSMMQSFYPKGRGRYYIHAHTHMHFNMRMNLYIAFYLCFQIVNVSPSSAISRYFLDLLTMFQSMFSRRWDSVSGYSSQTWNAYNQYLNPYMTGAYGTWQTEGAWGGPLGITWEVPEWSCDFYVYRFALYINNMHVWCM